METPADVMTQTLSEATADAPPARRRGRPVKAPTPPKAVEAAPEPVEAEEVADDRPPLRPAFREEDPRTRAARRAAELRNHGSLPDEGTDEFWIPRDIVPPGWDYEWKRRTVMGQEDPTYAVHLARAGWEPVPVSRHPQLMPSGWRGQIIERKGMVLMERPSEISEEARNMELRRARNQVRQKEQQLNSAPENQFGRDHEQVRAKIKKSYEAMPIPKD